MHKNFFLPGRYLLPAISFLFFSKSLFSQCTVQTGPPPPASDFNTGGGGGGTNDRHWQIATDSLNGTYKPAVNMSGLPDSYHNNSKWISFSAAGEHSGDKYFFYKRVFELPCFDQCGKSYNDDNTFCLNLDFYADNSIFEIYVNSIPQSSNLGGIIPLKPDPFNPVGHTENDRTSVSLCKDWRAGTNTLIVVLASSATVAGMEVEASVNPPPPPDADTVTAKICEGDSYVFGTQQLTKQGFFFQSFQRSSGCDSNVVLNLIVNPRKDTIINVTICEGQNFEGHPTSGMYITKYSTASGCDSTRTLNLIVNQKPKPVLGNNIALCPGDSLTLSPGAFSTYLWQDGSSGDHYAVTEPGLYSVTVTNACGTSTADLTIKNGTCGIYFPSAFTPNGDGKNDEFKVLTNAAFEAFDLSVYNRFGQKIFETTDPSIAWNGTYKGAMLSESAFVWYCNYKRQGKAASEKGTVVLIR